MRTQPSQFIIKGGKALSGSIAVLGSKNAALPILAATLLTEAPCTIRNVPRIEDIFRMIELIEGIGAKVVWKNERTVEITAKHIDPSKLDDVAISRLRASVLLVGPLLARQKKLSFNQPGGCNIGARSLTTHFTGFEALGVTISLRHGVHTASGRVRDFYELEATKLAPTIVTFQEFSVTATENLILTAALIPGTTTIKIAAAEPHVQQLCQVVEQMGAPVEGIGTHTITIKGAKKLKGFDCTLIPDYLETGTFLIAAASTRSRITITNCAVNDLDLFLEKLRYINVSFDIHRGSKPGTDTIEVRPSTHYKAFKIDTHPYPGFPTDLQAPMSILATQAEGTSLIHDTLYEGRMKHVEELNKMGANTIIADPHRALITGPTPLFGQDITSFDIRAGATLIIAALVAQGTSTIQNAYQVDRGYEQLDIRLKALGADIERV